MADAYSIHHVRDFSAATSQHKALNPGLNLRHDINTFLILNNYITFFCQFTTNTFKIHCQYIWITYEIHSKYSIYILSWYFSLSFGPCLALHSRPVTVCQAWCMECGGPHVDACPGVVSAGQHPTGHAGTSMPCRPKSMSGAAMPS